MTRGLFTVEDIEPKFGVLMSAYPVAPVLGRPNCGWLNRLKNSARNFKLMPSRGSANCLMTEKSVFAKSGPDTGGRDAFPSSPASGTIKAHGLNQSAIVCTREGAAQVGLLATRPALF